MVEGVQAGPKPSQAGSLKPGPGRNGAPRNGTTRNGPSGAEARRQEFEETALTQMPRLYQFARRLTRDKHEAEDVVQETYMRAWRFFHRFEKGTNVRAWLFRIMHNVFLNMRKKGSVKRELQMPEEEGMDDFLLYHHMVREGGWKDQTEMTPERFNHMFGDEVEKALDRLPELYRFPLLLCDVEGMSYDEIGKVLKLPGGTVRSRLFRARAQLQKDLVDYARKQGFIKARRET